MIEHNNWRITTKFSRREFSDPVVTINDVDLHYIAEFEGRTILGVSTAHREIEIYASPGGRSLRVWRDGKELK